MKKYIFLISLSIFAVAVITFLSVNAYKKSPEYIINHAYDTLEMLKAKDIDESACENQMSYKFDKREDFNGDGALDYVVFMKEKTKADKVKLYCMAFLADNRGQIIGSFVLQELGECALPVSLALSLVFPGVIDVEIKGKPVKISAAYPSIRLSDCGAGNNINKLFYWDKKISGFNEAVVK